MVFSKIFPSKLTVEPSGRMGFLQSDLQPQSHGDTETSPCLCGLRGQIEVWSAQAPKPTLVAAETRRESWLVDDRWVGGVPRWLRGVAVLAMARLDHQFPRAGRPRHDL